MAEAPAFLKKKVAGLPMGVWIAVIAAGVGVGLYIRHKNAQQAQDQQQQQDQTGQTIPYNQLQGSGGSLDTGGGFFGPPTPGGGAVRISGPSKPIRIIVRTKRPPRKKPHGGKQNKQHRR